MEKFVIKGGRKLSGTVKIESAKNAVLPMMAGALLTGEDVVIKNCPKIFDVINLSFILQSLGAKTRFYGEDLLINAGNISGYSVPDFLMKELRSSVFTVGALIGRTGFARFTLPGGCDLGERPINYHLSGLKEMGITVKEDGNGIFCYGKPKGKRIKLPYPSVGATENLMLAAVKGKGVTVIENCALEPEIVDLASLLNSMGAKITGAGQSKMQIEGVNSLHGTVYKPMPDRIETGTFIVSALITGGEIEIKNADTQNISFLCDKICNNTCNIDYKNDIIHVNSGKGLASFNVETGPYPAFPTDMQAPVTALATVTKGVSVIKETVFKDRFRYTEGLLKMGADIKVGFGTATVKGVKRLHGARVLATDLRGGAGLTLAALTAEGTSEVYGVEQIDRGYLFLDKKLSALGAEIKRIKEV